MADENDDAIDRIEIAEGLFDLVRSGQLNATWDDETGEPRFTVTKRGRECVEQMGGGSQ